MFEVHRVVVIPLAAPDEGVRLEDADDLPGKLVFKSDMAGARLPVTSSENVGPRCRSRCRSRSSNGQEPNGADKDQAHRPYEVEIEPASGDEF